jgi:hypothetical protein
MKNVKLIQKISKPSKGIKKYLEIKLIYNSLVKHTKKGETTLNPEACHN